MDEKVQFFGYNKRQGKILCYSYSLLTCLKHPNNIKVYINAHFHTNFDVKYIKFIKKLSYSIF